MRFERIQRPHRRRPVLLLAALLSIGHPAVAQIPSAIDADSLQSRLAAATGPARVDIRNLLATHYGEFEPDRGLQLAREILPEARALGYARGEARALENIGHALYFLGRYEAAFDTLSLACDRLEGLGETRLLGYCRLRVANVYNRTQRRDEAVAEIDRAVALLRQAGDEAGVGHAYNNLGWLHWRVGSFAEAISAYELALEQRQRLGQRRYLAATLNNMGIIYYQWGRYAQALDHYLRSLDIREDLHDLTGQARVLNNIGLVYLDWGDAARARDYFEAGLTRSDSSGVVVVRAYSLHNLGAALEAEGQLDAALERYQASLNLYGSVDNGGGTVLNRMAQGRVLDALGERRRAEQILRAALADARAFDDQEHEAEILLLLGRIAHGRGDVDRALRDLAESLSLARTMRKRDLIADVHRELSRALAEGGRHAEALDHLRQHNTMRDSLFSVRYGRELADMQTRYQTEALRRETEGQQQRLRAQEQRTRWVSAVLVLALVLAGVLGVAVVQARRAQDRLRHEAKERAEAEAALGASEAKFRNLTDNIPVGICRLEIEPTFRMVEANPAMVRIFDYESREALLAAPTKEIFGTPTTRIALFRQIVAGKAIDLTELRIRTHTGREFLGALRASAPQTAADGSRYVDGLIEDVTRRHEMEADLRQARDAAESASRAKTAFLANTSHEIRTPLNAILGYAQILRADRGLSDAQRRAVDTVERSGNHLLALINDILDISQIEAGVQALSPEDFDLAELVDDVSTMFELRCRQKGLAWKTDTGIEHSGVHGDRNKLRQVLINLLGNAVKFCPEGQVTLSVQQRGESVDFSVQDTGPGIPEERQQAIFEPFRQGSDERTEGGTGLGLAIAREHVELMGGRLTLDSAPGAGATFSFGLQLPAARVAVASRGPAQRQLAPGQRVRALVVDDVPENRDVLAQLLTAAGVEVGTADDGDEGLEAALTETWDVIFADIRMPRMRGDEMRRRLIEARGDRAPPVVAVSASALAHERRGLLAQGFDDFIDKPFRVETLHACLSRVLQVTLESADEDVPGAAAATAAPPASLPADLRDALRDAIGSHNASQLQRTLRRLEDDGHADLVRQLRDVSAGGYDIAALRRWLAADGTDLGLLPA